MSKLNKADNIFVLGMVLLIITAIAGALLGGVYKLTEEPIKAQEIKANNEALKQVLSQGENFDKIDFDKEAYESLMEVYQTSNNVGYAIKVETKGYGGSIVLVVGINNEGQVSGVHMLKHAETPGLGANANNSFFKERFVGRGPESLEVSKTSNDGNEVQAITGATITSKAIVNGVNDALDFFNKELIGKEGQQ